MDKIDRTILNKIVRGDRSPLQKVYEAYFAEIRRFIYFRVTNHHLAEDLVGSVFLKTMEYILRENTIDNIRAFLYRVARNEIAMHFRDRKMTLDLEDVPESSYAQDNDIEKDIDIGFDVANVTQILEALREDWRELVILRYLEDRSYEEISSILGKSQGAIRVILHRAIKEIQRIMKDGL